VAIVKPNDSVAVAFVLVSCARLDECVGTTGQAIVSCLVAKDWVFKSKQIWKSSFPGYYDMIVKMSRFSIYTREIESDRQGHF